jgi:hypothetical protein
MVTNKHSRVYDFLLNAKVLNDKLLNDKKLTWQITDLLSWRTDKLFKYKMSNCRKNKQIVEHNQFAKLFFVIGLLGPKRY